jgi:hypothetical protein
MRRDRLASLGVIGAVEWWLRAGQHGVGRFASSTRANDRGRKRAHPARGRLRYSARSSKPGGWEPVAACHAAAAPRWATRRETAAPTPNEIDQMSASRQRTPRDAGFSGGSWWRLARQRAVMALRHAAAAAAPDANANISHRRRCTSKSFPFQHVRQPVHRSWRFRIRRRGSTAVAGTTPRRRRWNGRFSILSRPSKWGAKRPPHVGEPTDQLLYWTRAQRGMPE